MVIVTNYNNLPVLDSLLNKENIVDFDHIVELRLCLNFTIN